MQIWLCTNNHERHAQQKPNGRSQHHCHSIHHQPQHHHRTPLLLITSIMAMVVMMMSTMVVAKRDSGDIYKGHHVANYSYGWDIWVSNESGQALQFLLYQQQFEPGVDSYQAAWRVGMLPSPGSAGPFHLPFDIGVAVYDFDDSDVRAGQERMTGPYPARWRDRWSFQLADVDDIPELDRIEGALPRRRHTTGELIKEVRIENSAHSYKPVSVGITKDGYPIVRQDNVRPDSSEIITVTDYIYITYIQPGSLVQGDHFKSVNIGAPSKGFRLTAGQKYVLLKIRSKPSGEITYSMSTGAHSQLSRRKKSATSRHAPEWSSPGVTTYPGNHKM